VQGRSFGEFERSPDIFSQKVKKKIKSICLDSEPILEELEEYQDQDVDPKHHTFVIPITYGSRRESSDFGYCEECQYSHDHQLEPIEENNDEDEGKIQCDLCKQSLLETVNEDFDNEGFLEQQS